MSADFVLNWWALLVTIVWSLALGMIWYSPRVFFTIWQKAEGITDEQMKAANPTGSMIFGLIANSVTLYALGVLINLSGAQNWWAGLGWGLFAALGFITAAEINNGAFRMTKPVVYLIDGGYRVVMMAIAGLVFAIW